MKTAGHVLDQDPLRILEHLCPLRGITRERRGLLHQSVEFLIRPGVASA